MRIIDLLGRLRDALERGLPLGARGERRAARWLAARGYRVLRRNLRVGRDEADLVALDPDGRTLVVVEVKPRRRDDLWPEAALDRRKRRCLERVAQQLARRPGHRGRPVRIDAITIVWPRAGAPEVRHYMDAFE